MKALSIIFFTAYLIAPLFAFSEVYQQNNDDILVLDKDSEGDYIGTYLYYVRDDNYELDITKVSSPEFSSSFKRSEMERPNFGNEELAIWNKFTVINQSESDWDLT